MRGIGNEVFTDLLSLMLISLVANDDASDRFCGITIEWGGIDKSTSFAMIFAQSTRGGLLGEDDLAEGAATCF